MKCMTKTCNRQAAEKSNYCSDHQPTPPEKLYANKREGGLEQKSGSGRVFERRDRPPNDKAK